MSKSLEFRGRQKVVVKVEDNVSTKRRNRPYLNEAGPGDYETPSLFGTKTNVAGRRNGPKFTFGG